MPENKDPIQGKVGQPETADSLKWASVASTELGTNCWLPQRFVKGVRCDKVLQCKYPERKTCCAVKAEIDYLAMHIIEVQRDACVQMHKLAEAAIKLMADRDLT